MVSRSFNSLDLVRRLQVGLNIQIYQIYIKTNKLIFCIGNLGFDYIWRNLQGRPLLGSNGQQHFIDVKSILKKRRLYKLPSYLPFQLRTILSTKMAFSVFAFLLSCLFSLVVTSTSLVITTNPSTNLTMTEGQTGRVNWSISCDHSSPVTVLVSLDLNRHAEIEGQSRFTVPGGEECRRNNTFVVNLKTHRIGREKLGFK